METYYISYMDEHNTPEEELPENIPEETPEESIPEAGIEQPEEEQTPAEEQPVVEMTMDDPESRPVEYLEEDRSEEISKYTKFRKVNGETYRKVNVFLRKRTYITAREWAIARLCSDFKTPYGAEMTFIGQHLPELCPFMEETYTPQAVNQARSAFKRKVRKSGATFFYGAMCGFFTMDELDDILFESSEIAKFLLEIEGTSLDIDEEIDIEDKISEIMRKVGESANLILKSRQNPASDDIDEDDEDEDDEEDEEEIKTSSEESADLPNPNQ